MQAEMSLFFHEEPIFTPIFFFLTNFPARTSGTVRRSQKDSTKEPLREATTGWHGPFAERNGVWPKKQTHTHTQAPL